MCDAPVVDFFTFNMVLVPTTIMNCLASNMSRAPHALQVFGVLVSALDYTRAYQIDAACPTRFSKSRAKSIKP